MKLIGSSLLLCIFSLSLAYASHRARSASSASQEETDVIARLMLLPFRDLVCSGIAMTKNEDHLLAVASRPEFLDIDWAVEDCGELARQLWRFQLDESDRSYHMSLAKMLQVLMSFHGLSLDCIKKVRAITSSWVKARGSKLHNINSTSTESFARKEEKRLRKNYYNKKRLADRKKGLSLPLLEYIGPERFSLKTPEEFHQRALLYRHMYPSSHAFVLALRSMWRSLGYKDEEVHDQNTDPQNRSHTYWDFLQDQQALASARDHQAAQPSMPVFQEDLNHPLALENETAPLQCPPEIPYNPFFSFLEPNYTQEHYESFAEWPITTSESMGLTDSQPLDQEHSSYFTEHGHIQ